MFTSRKVSEKHGIGPKKPPNPKPQVLNPGTVAQTLASWIKNGGVRLRLLGFLDDDSNLRGKSVLGFKIIGRESDIPTIHKVHHIDEIWLTFRPETPKEIRLRKICKQSDINLVTLPDSEPFSRFSAPRLRQPQ